MGDRDYKEASTLCNLLPPLYMKVLKELLLYNNIYLGHFDMDFSEFAEINWNGRRTRINRRDSNESIFGPVTATQSTCNFVVFETCVFLERGSKNDGIDWSANISKSILNNFFYSKISFFLRFLKRFALSLQA